MLSAVFVSSGPFVQRVSNPLGDEISFSAPCCRHFSLHIYASRAAALTLPCWAQARPAISPAAVRIYQVPPRHFEQIAIINSSAGTTWIFPNHDSLNEAFADLRNEAAALGANGFYCRKFMTSRWAGFRWVVEASVMAITASTVAAAAWAGR